MFFFGPLFLFFPIIAFLILGRLLSVSFRGRMQDRRRTQPLEERREPEEGRIRRALERFESQVYALAYRLGGRLTVSDAVIETGLSTKEAETLLDGLTDEVRVRATVSDAGFMVYEFPEIIERLRREGK